MRTLTPRILGEILQHEGLAREAYRDSVGVWTWSVGITDASGHKVARYRDNPQTIGRCLEVFVWLLETRYLPAVLRHSVPSSRRSTSSPGRCRFITTRGRSGGRRGSSGFWTAM